MTSLQSQFIALGVMLFAGLTIGFLFDVHRVIRSLIRPRSTSSLVMDLLFWIFITPAFFLLLLLGNWGELRLYVFLGVAAGLFAYFQLISPTVLWALITGARRLGRTVVGILCFAARLWGAPAALCHDMRLWRRRAGARLRAGWAGWRPRMQIGWRKPGARWRKPGSAFSPARIMPPWGRTWPFWRK